MRTVNEIIEDIESMQVGESRFYKEGDFYIDRFSADFRFWGWGGKHHAAKAESLKLYIRKAINYVQKQENFEQ